MKRLFRLALGRGATEAEADDELELHVELRTEELIAEGIDPKEARRRAELALGDRQRLRRHLVQIDHQSFRTGRRREAIQTFVRDLKHAVRSLRRDPWFTAGAGLIVALAVGLNTVVSSALNSAFLRPLPYPDSDRIVRLYEVSQSGHRIQVAARNTIDWREHARSIERLAIFGAGEVTLVDDGEPE